MSGQATAQLEEVRPRSLYLAILYRWRHGRWPDFRSPALFTEWVQWRKLNDRCADLAGLTDKAHGKQIAARELGSAMVVTTLWQGQQLPRHPDWSMPFIVKANHGCGQFVVVRSTADWRRARRAAKRWMLARYGGLLGEWHYRAATPAILVEPFLGDANGLPIDYKVYVFGGRAATVQVHQGRGIAHRWTQYDRDWNCLSKRGDAGLLAAPVSLPVMLEAAERLGAGHDFLRVDFYEVDGKPLFGEFCLYPGSGLDPFDPLELDAYLGGLWSAQRTVHPAK